MSRSSAKPQAFAPGVATSEVLARRLKALADPVRLEVLRLLPETDRCEDVYNVSELAAEIGVAQPTVSHHLGILRNAGLVQSKKMCRYVYYWVDRKELNALLGAVKKLRPVE